jgi:RimJ/RimL family protein N-acetyltransferase
VIQTGRLILRGWRDSDHYPFYKMSQDPQVMATLGPLLSREESAAGIARLEGIRETHGYTFWAIERREDQAFLGFCGVKPGPADTPIEGEMEIGWRLAAAYWGQGYAHEAARASLDWVWANTGAPHVAAITTPGNVRSWGLMERLGMTRAPEDDFDHPALPADSALLAHITYRVPRPGS